MLWKTDFKNTGNASLSLDSRDLKTCISHLATSYADTAWGSKFTTILQGIHKKQKHVWIKFNESFKSLSSKHRPNLKIYAQKNTAQPRWSSRINSESLTTITPQSTLNIAFTVRNSTANPPPPFRGPYIWNNVLYRDKKKVFLTYLSRKKYL